MKISLIIPSRNNLKYLKWAYDSIRKNQGEHEVEICVADDFSNDGTWDWCLEMMEKDSNFKAIRNEGPARLGLVVLNDKLINEVATNEICMIYHADMYLCPEALDAVEQELQKNTIVSLTRIEPPLHPPGVEKVLLDCGIEPEEFDEQKLLDYLNRTVPTDSITEGVFAPWAFYKKDFQDIGGHDILFAPQSKEDSDIFNRFYLNGIKFIQTWHGFVYHMTSRGSRFNPSAGGAPGQDSPEWLHTTTVNMRNFIRKWGHAVKHDEYLKPVIPPKYDIGYIIHNSSDRIVSLIEPWGSNTYIDHNGTQYVLSEDKLTAFDMVKRVRNQKDDKYNDILIEFDARNLDQANFNYIQNMSEILSENLDDQSGENLIAGTEFELGVFKITVNKLKTYEKDLIICK